MLKVGITGGIGSGKSIVCEVFKHFGIPVYYADIEANNLIISDKNIKKQLIEHFGKKIYSRNQLNKSRFSSIIFNDKKALQKVNSIIHPVVRQNFKDWIKKNKDKKYIIKEAALLFESGTYQDLDEIITISAPEHIKIKRIMKRDKTDKESVQKRIRNQISDTEKIRKSDHVIYNNGSQLILPQILSLHKIFLTRKRG